MMSTTIVLMDSDNATYECVWGGRLSQRPPRFFQIRKKYSYKSDQWHICADVVYCIYIIYIGKVAKYSRCDPGYTEGETEEQSGDETELIGQ